MDNNWIEAFTLLKDLPLTMVLLYLILRLLFQQSELIKHLQSLTDKMLEHNYRITEKIQDSHHSLPG